MDSNYFWTITFGLAIGTFSIRSSFILLSGKIKPSERTKEIFSFIPAAILPALLTPLVYFHQGQVEALLNKERLCTLLLASLVCIYSRSMVVTILFGLTFLFFVTQLFN